MKLQVHSWEMTRANLRRLDSVFCFLDELLCTGGAVVLLAMAPQQSEELVEMVATETAK